MRLHHLITTAAALLTLAACGDDKKRPIGDSCQEDAQCEAGLCLSNFCLIPEEDADTDTLINQTEHALGLNPTSGDTDGDGIDDATEVGGDTGNPVDTDGDGKIDAAESNILDADSDCIPDQLDADDATPESDAAKRALVMCRREGVCATSGARATCENLELTCDYTNVVGYEADETSCDGRDNDCDGDTDERFAAGGSVTFGGAGIAADAGKVLGDACGVGACAGGTVVCDPNDVAALACSSAGQAGPLTCGSDNNCDGTPDDGEDIANCASHFVDGDGDTWGTGAARCLCGPDATHTATRDGDCDDADDKRHPTAAPICGVDADCDEGLVDAGELCDDGNDDALDGCNACAGSPGRFTPPFPDSRPVGILGLGAGGWMSAWSGYIEGELYTGTRLDFQSFDSAGLLAGDTIIEPGDESWLSFVGRLGAGYVALFTRSWFDPETEQWESDIGYRMFSADGTELTDGTAPIPWGERTPDYFSFARAPWIPLPGGGGLALVELGFIDESCEWGTCYENHWLVFDDAQSFVGAVRVPADISIWDTAFATAPDGALLALTRRIPAPNARELPSFDVWRFASYDEQPSLLFNVGCVGSSCYDGTVALAADGRFWLGWQEEVTDSETGAWRRFSSVRLTSATGEVIGDVIELPSGPESMYGGGYVLERTAGGVVWALPSTSNNERNAGDTRPKGGETNVVTPDTMEATAFVVDGNTLRVIPLSGINDVVCSGLADDGVACLGYLSTFVELGPEEWTWINEAWMFRYASDGSRLPTSDPWLSLPD